MSLDFIVFLSKLKRGLRHTLESVFYAAFQLLFWVFVYNAFYCDNMSIA